MKFTPLAKKKAADEEYEMFSYLHAINEPGVCHFFASHRFQYSIVFLHFNFCQQVEAYGIPTVFYYGEWQELIMMGFSLLDNDLEQLVDSKSFFESDVNVLLVLRDFVSANLFQLQSFETFDNGRSNSLDINFKIHSRQWR